MSTQAHYIDSNNVAFQGACNWIMSFEDKHLQQSTTICQDRAHYTVAGAGTGAPEAEGQSGHSILLLDRVHT